jgi:hypothetical protein
MYGNISKDFAIQTNFRPFEAGHKNAIRETVEAGSSINTYNPQATKIALTCLAITIGKTPTALNRFSRFPEQLAPGTAITLRVF